MESKTNEVQLIQQVKDVQGLIEEKLQGLPVDQRLTSEDEEEEEDAQVLLSKLLLQLDALQGTSASKDIIVLETDSLAPDELISTRSELNNDVADEIIKELKKVQRQNVMTHCLLSAILVLTLVCQLSEMALVSKVKRGLNNPVKALGGLILGMVVRPRNGQSKVKEADESHSLPKIKVELPRVEIPKLSGED